MERGKPKRESDRTEIDATHRAIDDEAPGEARVRGPEERTPGENVLGEDLRADDELLGEQPRSADDLLAHADSEAVPDRIAEEQQARQDIELAHDEGDLYYGREAPEAHGSGDLADVEDEPGFEALREPEDVLPYGSLDEPDDQGPLAREVESEVEPSDEELGEVDVTSEGAPATGEFDEGILVPAGPHVVAAEWFDDDPEKVERAAAWEHAPDLEKTSMILERGEGEAGSLAVSRPGEQAIFDPISSAAYDEPLPGTVDLRVPGAGITVERARDVEPTVASADGAVVEPAPARPRRAKKPKAETAAKGAKAPARKSKSKKASATAEERPRRKTRRSSSKREQPGKHEAGSP